MIHLGHIWTARQPRRCRREWRFIGTFQALAAVGPRSQAPLTALSQQPLTEGADESDVSSAPSGNLWYCTWCGTVL